MKIIHFSDTHIGFQNYDKVNNAGINTREQDFYDAFQFVINQILEYKPDLVIHTGDFFHRPSPTNRALTFALEQLKKLSFEKIPIVIIAGNHSTPKTIYTSPILRALKTIENVFPIFNQSLESFEFGDLVIHGIPHINDIKVQQEAFGNLKPVLGKINILMLHTSIGKRYLMEEYGEKILTEEYYTLINSFDYVALGHWHNFQKVPILENAWYSGSTERLSENEINSEKGFCLLDF